MCDKLYPWGGKISVGRSDSCVALVSLSEELDFETDEVAVFGSMKTENLGVEKVVANICSNPNIRYLILCGNDVRGHRSGDALLKLHKFGIDSNNRIIDAVSAIPFIENLPAIAIERFQQQIELVDMIGVVDTDKIMEKARSLLELDPGPFGEPLFIEVVERERVTEVISSDIALHSHAAVDLYGLVNQIEEGH